LTASATAIASAGALQRRPCRGGHGHPGPTRLCRLQRRETLHRHHVFNQGSGRGAEIEFAAAARGIAPSAISSSSATNSASATWTRCCWRSIASLPARRLHLLHRRDLRRRQERAAPPGRDCQARVRIGFQTRIDSGTKPSSTSSDAPTHLHRVRHRIHHRRRARRTEQELPHEHERLSELLIYARQRIPWVQANLILTEHDDRDQIRRWQEQMKAEGVWVSEPVPMYPFPGSPLYLQTFGAPPDDQAGSEPIITTPQCSTQGL